VNWFDFEEQRRLEYGYRLVPEARGKGYATEAGRALLGAEHERVDAPQRHVRDDAERTEPDFGGGLVLDDRAGAVDQGQPLDERGQAAEAGAGTVRPGGDGAGDRLHVDVAQVRQRQPVPGEQPVEHRQIGTGADRDQLPFQVDRADPGQPVQAQPGTVGDRGGGERVPGADRLDRPPVRPRLLDRLGDLLDRSRAQFSGAVPLLLGEQVNLTQLGAFVARRPRK